MFEDREMGCTEATEHHIEVTDPRPFKERPRNIPEGLLQEVKDHLDHMLDVGASKPSNSAWSNMVVLVRKKDGGLRFCIDFRYLNSCRELEPFGLCNAPATFQQLMQNCLSELNNTTCLVYLDDIVIYTSTQEEHLDQLREVLEWFHLNGLKLKPSKCSFF